MEINDNFLKLKITTQDMLKMLLVGLTGMVGVIVCISYGIYLLYGSLKFGKIESILLIFKSITLWNLVPFLVFLGFAFWISSIFFCQGLRDINFFLKYQGIFFYMDTNGMQFYNFNTKEFKIKKWSDFEDVGCYKQESDNLIYKYQIKFTDGDIYEFDLRGTIPTKEFEYKIEEFYLKYSE